MKWWAVHSKNCKCTISTIFHRRKYNTLYCRGVTMTTRKQEGTIYRRTFGFSSTCVSFIRRCVYRTEESLPEALGSHLNPETHALPNRGFVSQVSPHADVFSVASLWKLVWGCFRNKYILFHSTWSPSQAEKSQCKWVAAFLKGPFNVFSLSCSVLYSFWCM